MRHIGGMILFLDESNAFNRLLWRQGLKWQDGRNQGTGLLKG